MMVLRTYRRVAQVQHWCDRCFDWIQPGDYYEGIVQVNGKKLTVFKFHIDPICNYPPDPFDDDDISNKNTLENEFSKAA